MSLPSDFDNEINALRREYERSKPTDVLQFAANHFLRRLEAQRAEHLLASTHSSQKGTPAMAQSTFPGTNPFVSSDGGMQRIGEEEEHEHPGSPKAEVAPGSPGAPTDTATGQESSFGSFGAFNFGGNSGDSGNRMPPMGGSSSLPNNYNFNRRTSVSAESMNPADSESENWSPPNHPKTDDQMKRLREAVARNFIFSHLDEEQTSQVLGALVEKQIPAKGMRIISQGDVGDYFYVVEDGQFDIHVSKTGKVEPGADGSGTKVNEVGPGGSFGELALMYNAPRAATVTSTAASTLWQLDRVTFRRILMDSAFNRRKMYENFLAEVPLLKSLTDYERSRIADALNTEKHPAGFHIIKEGAIGDNFYLLEAGKAEVYKRGTEAPVHSYDKGDYFGELALLNNEPRAASVVSVTDVKLATLSKDGFHRLLGPAVVEEMKKNDPRHKAG